jgi:ribosomal protein S6
VRGFENLGDRIIAKNIKAKDGNKYGVGRYVAVEFDGTPKAVQSAIEQAHINTETLKTYVHKISEKDYLKRTIKRLNQEMSPFRDESTKDPAYVRDMWEQYSKSADHQAATTNWQVKRNPEQVYAYLKNMEEG